MSKVAIVTDSTANLPKNLLEKYQIQVAPLVLIWDGETYRDGIDIQPKEFYERLSSAKSIPSTSQATVNTFKEIYSTLIEKEYQILTLVISSKLSGTVESAQLARSMFPKHPIEIVDSYSTSMALGFQVIEGAKAAIQGASLLECKNIVEEARARSGVLFVVDTLEFLHKGGRIGGASRFLGTALNLKPILELMDGKIEAVERVRTSRKAFDRLFTLLEDRLDGKAMEKAAVIHANVEQQALSIYEEVKQQFAPKELFISDVSPVIGTHSGPGTIGIAFQRRK